MKIKKIGHCCLVIEINKLRILTDPGAFTSAQNKIKSIDLVLITHEHADHFHLESLKEIVENNPNVRVISNSSVGQKIKEAGLPYEVLEGGVCLEIGGIKIEAFDCRHEEIFENVGQVPNTGYLIADKLFYPGDSFGEIEKPVEILALPVAGPWCKIGDAIRYALKVAPQKVFPVHDGLIREDLIQVFHKTPSMILAKNNIEFVAMLEGDEREFD